VGGRFDRFAGRGALLLSVGLALMLGVTATVVAWPRVAGTLGMAPAPAGPPYRVGETLDVPAEWYGRTPATLVVFAKSSCAACQQAAPFLRELIQTVKAGGNGSVLGGASSLPGGELPYGQLIGLDADAVKIKARSGNRVKAVPTLVLVDQHGKVLGSWQGIPKEREPALREAILTALNGF
jgi:hypothetical protein